MTIDDDDVPGLLESRRRRSLNRPVTISEVVSAYIVLGLFVAFGLYLAVMVIIGVMNQAPNKAAHVDPTNVVGVTEASPPR